MKSDQKLKPFQITPATSLYEIEASATLTKQGLRVAFLLRSKTKKSLSALRLPPPKSEANRERRDGLWKKTCLECFVGVKDSPAYFEFNAAPEGDWAWYSFKGYRDGMASPAADARSAPRRLTEHRTETSFEIEWEIPRSLFNGEAIDRLSLTAVLATDRETSYWAVSHAGREADFHLRDSFTVPTTAKD